MATSVGLAGPWNSLPTPLTPWVLDVIQGMGHVQMTPVQASTIPLFMKNKDVMVEAVTGSGKTLAFVIPILERLIRREGLLRKNEIGALVISPTRELATQIHSIFSLFLTSQDKDKSSNGTTSKCNHPLPLLLVASAQSSPSQDIQRFLSTGADIIIGTPGRLEEFLLGKGKNVVNPRELEVLVLDEADRLLDMGFERSLTRIISHLPKQRRTGLFSATMTDADAFSELIRVGLRNPARVVVNVQSKKLSRNIDENRFGEVIQERRIPAGLDNFYLSCRASEKTLQLARIISHDFQHHGASQFIVYFATCACVDYFFKVLPAVLPLSVTLHSLHGNIPPAARTRTLTAFSSEKTAPPSALSVLLATDIAARGLDIPNVDVVIQFDPPSDPRTFSHRCGRTARAGRSGRAWVLLVGRETDYVDFLSIRKIPLKEHPSLLENGLLNNSAVHRADGEDPEVQRIFDRVRSVAMNDRAIHDKAVKAFVSFVRAYSKHEASYIFRIQDLDLVGIAKAFALLRLPKMPELRKRSCQEWEDADVDWANFSYANDAQEAKRIASSANRHADEETEQLKQKRVEQRKVNSAWSKKAERKAERELRREKKARKRKWLTAKSQAPGTNQGALPKGNWQAIPEKEDDDWEELAREERMAKKLRKGTIDQETFDAEFGEV